MVRGWEMTKTKVTSQKIEHEPRDFEAVWAVAIVVTHAGGISDKPVRLQVESTYIPENYVRVLT